jgi:hypothetical protein
MGPARRPTRNQAITLFSSLSVFFFALLCLLAFCLPVVTAEDAHPEYGTVIGIGEYSQNNARCSLTLALRFGDNVCIF